MTTTYLFNYPQFPPPENKENITLTFETKNLKSQLSHFWLAENQKKFIIVFDKQIENKFLNCSQEGGEMGGRYEVWCTTFTHVQSVQMYTSFQMGK